MLRSKPRSFGAVMNINELIVECSNLRRLVQMKMTLNDLDLRKVTLNLIIWPDIYCLLIPHLPPLGYSTHELSRRKLMLPSSIAASLKISPNFYWSTKSSFTLCRCSGNESRIFHWGGGDTILPFLFRRKAWWILWSLRWVTCGMTLPKRHQQRWVQIFSQTK